MRHLRQWCRVLAFVVVSFGAVPCRVAAEPPHAAPSCVGLASAEVAARLDQTGWKVEWRSAGPAPGSQQQGRVASQAPPAGAAMPAGTPLILWVYEGAAAAAPAPGSVAGAGAAPDCSRWPGSVADPATGSCLCSGGQWWRFDGQGCATREQAAALFCSAAWAGSVPVWSSGSFHCDCPPELFWDAEALSCGGASAEAAADCSERWPGTAPVFSPGASAYECACTDGSRWEESRQRCQASVESVGGVVAPQLPSAAAGVASPPDLSSPAPPTLNADAPAAGPSSTGGAAAASDSGCGSLLAEIASYARARQGPEAESLALRAATRGCDPGAISEAVRGVTGAAGAAAPTPEASPPLQRPAMRY